jgi:hypothetical protein
MKLHIQFTVYVINKKILFFKECSYEDQKVLLFAFFVLQVGKRRRRRKLSKNGNNRLNMPFILDNSLLSFWSKEVYELFFLRFNNF